MIFAAAPTAADYWMLVAVFVLLIVLTGLSLAEMSLSRITKQKAQAMVEEHKKRSHMKIRPSG